MYPRTMTDGERGLHDEAQRDAAFAEDYVPTLSEWNTIVRRVERLEKLLDRLQAVTTYVE